MANGTASIEASSGRVRRHRLNRGGNRQLNKTIHTAALTQIAHRHTEGRRYYERCLARGKPNEKPSAPSNEASQTASEPTSTPPT